MADEFDPDAFLRGSSSVATGFDPDSFLGITPPPAPQPEISTAQAAADIPLSAGIGVVKGGMNLAGLPGDIRELAASGASKAAGALGLDVSPETISKGLRFLPVPGAAGPT